MNDPVYYNEFDPKTAAWLRELGKADCVPFGEVDERSIEDVLPDELRRFSQCHFFAGIGGWSYALRLAGWPAERRVWTGSCPCQPFSQAGKRKGFADERHLWPAWFHLIDQLRPDTIFGEQVAGPNGETWFDLVSADLEAIGYAIGMAVLPSAGFGAPHARHRIYFVGHNTRANANGSTKYRRNSLVQVGRIGRKKADEKIFDQKRTQWANQPRPALLANGIHRRLELVRGFGNAIVPQVAAEFIKAFMSAESEL